MSEVKNTLKYAQLTQLSIFLDRNRNEIVNFKTWGEVAKWATAQLGFEITDNNLKTIAKTMNLNPSFAVTASPFARMIAALDRKYDERFERLEKLLAAK